MLVYWHFYVSVTCHYPVTRPAMVPKVWHVILLMCLLHVKLAAVLMTVHQALLCWGYCDLAVVSPDPETVTFCGQQKFPTTHYL